MTTNADAKQQPLERELTLTRIFRAPDCLSTSLAVLATGSPATNFSYGYLSSRHYAIIRGTRQIQAHTILQGNWPIHTLRLTTPLPHCIKPSSYLT